VLINSIPDIQNTWKTEKNNSVAENIKKLRQREAFFLSIFKTFARDNALARLLQKSALLF